MDQAQMEWLKWLSSLTPEQRNGLRSALSEEVDVKVTRIPTDDLYIRNPPMFIDTNCLHMIYNTIGFTTNLLIKGPKGEGKSVSIFSWAAAKNLPVVKVECSEDTKKYDLQGSQFLIGDETIYVLGGIPTAIEVANEVGHCVLLFEEVNALTPQVQKQLNAITDFRKQSSLPHIGKTYELKPGAQIWVVATMNPAAYGGTYDLNEDLKSRFEEIEIGYPKLAESLTIVRSVCGSLPGVDDQLLTSLVKLCNESRQKVTKYALSTRDLVRMTKMVSVLGLETALQLMVCKFEGEDRKVMLNRIGSHFKLRVPLKSHWGATSGE